MSTKKSSGPNVRQITNLLQESKLDPRKPGPLKVIFDSGSVDYLMLRAVEFIHESLDMERTLDLDFSEKSDSGQWLYKPEAIDGITKAISLLAMAKWKMRNGA